MFPYKPGDVVRVHNYPFVSKAEQERLKDSDQTQEQPAFQGKPRFGVVINAGGRNVEMIPIMQIMSHGGQTERHDYNLRDDEVRLPENISYQKRSGPVDIYGVIKTERIESFEADEITPPLTSIPLRTKIDLIERYEAIMKVDYFRNKLDVDSPNHSKVMADFKTSVLAEKLDFLVSNNGERKFDRMQNSPLRCKEIQKLGSVGKDNRIGLYAVNLQGRHDNFTYIIGTMKNEKQLAKDWAGPKKAKDWLSEDIKFHILKKNIDSQLRPNPLVNSDKFMSFTQFSKQALGIDIEKKHGETDLEL
nr:hypothetical protein P5645_22220 [Bacillus subtilis]